MTKANFMRCSHCLKMSDVRHGNYSYCFDCEARYVQKDIKKEEIKQRHREAKQREETIKKSRVECWHCGDKDQRIQSLEEGFNCTKCKGLLWTGDGGFTKVNGVVFP